MRLVSPLLKRVLYPCLAQTGFLRRQMGEDDLCVVTYHGVLPARYRALHAELDGALVTAESFRLHLRLLKSRYHVISAQQFLIWRQEATRLPPRAVLLTCDDGLRNTLTDMVPILQEEEVTCLFFVTGASLRERPGMLWYEELYLMLLTASDCALSLDLGAGVVQFRSGDAQTRHSVWWSLVKALSGCDSDTRRELLENARVELQLPENWNLRYVEDALQQRRFLLLTLMELRQLAAAGMPIGAHSLSHPRLSQLPSAVAWKEIAECRSALASALGEPVWSFAYPFGDPAAVSERELEMAERSGYKCAFLNTGGRFGRGVPAFAIPRVHVTADMSLAELEAHVSGFQQALRRRLTGAEFIPAAAVES
jgi:peptidoglycan/xylan/chitin deacetylase (PgdA/CDA1 family)